MQPTRQANVAGWSEQAHLEERHDPHEPIDDPGDVAQLWSLLDAGITWERQQSVTG